MSAKEHPGITAWVDGSPTIHTRVTRSHSSGGLHVSVAIVHYGMVTGIYSRTLAWSATSMMIREAIATLTDDALKHIEGQIDAQRPRSD